MQHCPVCKSCELQLFADTRTVYLDGIEKYAIYRCAECGHGNTVGRKDSAFLEKIYTEGFHQTSQQDAFSKNAPINCNARQRAQWLKSILQSGRLLDVGSGTGAFVSAANNAGFVATGIELSGTAAYAGQAAGLDIRQGNFFDIEPPQQSYDVVTMWDVLAGFDDCAAVIRRAAGHLAPNGLLVLTVPMLDSLVARLSRKFWPLLIPPVNLNYFSRRSLEMLGDEGQLTITEISYPGKIVALNFLVLKALRSARLLRFAAMAHRWLPVTPISVNSFDIAMVQFRRREWQP